MKASQAMTTSSGSLGWQEVQQNWKANAGGIRSTSLKHPKMIVLLGKPWQATTITCGTTITRRHRGKPNIAPWLPKAQSLDVRERYLSECTVWDRKDENFDCLATDRPRQSSAFQHHHIHIIYSLYSSTIIDYTVDKSNQ